MPRRIAAPIALLVVLAAGCGGSDSTSSTPITSPSASASTATTTAGSAAATTKAATSGGDASSFCNKLSDGADQAAALLSSVGKPDMTAMLEKIRAENVAILAAAPADIRDAIAKVYSVSELAQKSLDPTMSAADRQAATKAISDATKDPSFTAAIASYSTWVTKNCGDLATKIMRAGTGG